MVKDYTIVTIVCDSQAIAIEPGVSLGGVQEVEAICGNLSGTS